MANIEAKIIADSISEAGARITTMELRYPRFIHAEFMTHRTFCIGGDARLDFDMPGGKSTRRVHSMTIREFADKWFNGAARGASSRHNGKNLAALLPDTSYSVDDVATQLGFASVSNLRTLCRTGVIKGAVRSASGVWSAPGRSWSAWRQSTGTRTFSLQSRLSNMRIRQVNERDGKVQTATVSQVIPSGVKSVLRVVAGDFSTVATADHRVFTADGWKRLGDLQVGVDRLITYKYGSGASEDPYRKIDGQWVSRWNNSVRDQVASRQQGLCWVSGAPLQPSFHIHHVVPRHERPDLAFDLGNVVAVNADEHRLLHENQGWQVGVPLGSTATLVESVEPAGEMDTYDLEISGAYPNFFADGIVVHNSRNASSSRAIPVRKMLAQVWSDPAMPEHWGANQAGMQARSELAGVRRTAARWLWRAAGKVACGFTWLAMRLGLHKQVANRLLEPWQRISVVVTSTEWDNFFALRAHPDAQPEIRVLAEQMRDVMAASTPQLLRAGAWHTPYFLDGHSDSGLGLKCSVARCARVSYLTHDGKKSDLRDDSALHDKLLGGDPPHLSPFEHQATPAAGWHANFNGWQSLRNQMGY